MNPVAAVARYGPYFVWQARDDDPEWQPLAGLCDEDVLAGRVAGSRDLLARMAGCGRDDIPERVVASVTFLGLASRLVSPALAAAAVAGSVPIPDTGRMWWRPVAGGPVPIACRDLAFEDCAGLDPAAVAEIFVRTTVRGLVEPVLAAHRRRFGLSDHVLWGNVASALGGAAGMIADAEPEHAARTAAVVAAVLELPPLRGTARLDRPDPERPRWFLVRNNCCLYYRIPGGGTCGDCVLTPERDRHRQWQAVLSR